MLKEPLTALKHGQVMVTYKEKRNNNLLVWHKYYSDELSDTNRH